MITALQIKECGFGYDLTPNALCPKICKHMASAEQAILLCKAVSNKSSWNSTKERLNCITIY